MKTGIRCLSVLLAVLMVAGCFGFTFAEASDYSELTVIASPAAGGIVSGSGQYYGNDTATLTATPNHGYGFIGWYRGEQLLSGESTFVFTPTAVETITAKFEMLQICNVAVNVKGTGQVFGAGAYYVGETVTLKAVSPSETDHFCGWYDPDTDRRVSAEKEYRFVVQSDIALEAIFTSARKVTGNDEHREGIELRIEPEGAGVLFAEKEPAYDWDYDYFLRACPNEGYRFVEWNIYSCHNQDHYPAFHEEPCDQTEIKTLTTERFRYADSEYFDDAPSEYKIVAKFEKIAVSPEDSHTHTPGKTVVPAKIGKAGSVITLCTVCGETLSNTAIPAIKTVKLSKTKYTYDAKKKAPAVTVLNSQGEKLKAGTDYTVQYSSGRKAVGTYKVKVTFKGNYAGSKTLSFQIVLGKVTGLKVAAGKQYAQLKWTPVKGATNYAVYYATKQNGKFKKAFTTRGATAKVQKLKTGKTYYFCVRAVAKIQKGTFYGAASAVKKVKIK